MIIHRFVLNNSIHFIWENKKWKNLELYRKCTCISIMLQCMHLCIYNGYVQGVDQKYFWTWNKITHYSTIQRFNIHYTRLRILTSYTYCDVYRVRTLLNRIHTRGMFASMSQITGSLFYYTEIQYSLYKMFAVSKNDWNFLYILWRITCEDPP